MFFDPARNAYVDAESGQIVCLADEDESEMIRSAMLTTGTIASPATHDKQKRRSKREKHKKHTQNTYAMRDDDFADELIVGDREEFERMFELAAMQRQQQQQQQQGTRTQAPCSNNNNNNNNLSNMERELYDALTHTPPADNTHNGTTATVAGTTTTTAGDNDWNFARTLQLLEFEIANEEMEGDAFDDFQRKEYRASRSCRRQLATISFLICVVQIALLIAMVETDGWASSSENPAMGPPVTSMVRYGAKDAALILYRDEWWRLLSSTMLHAGLYHIIPNVAIQLRVGGYLNLVYGTPTWLWIYIISGIFGQMMSCIFIPDSVGVGSSGALMGMLASWVVWIIFRWKKIPPECKSQRNCQLSVVIVSIVVTLATSFMPRVDWAAHAGGALMGALWGVILLSSQLDNNRNQLYARMAAFAAFAIIFGYSLFYMIEKLHPSRDLLSYWADNDEW